MNCQSKYDHYFLTVADDWQMHLEAAARERPMGPLRSCPSLPSPSPKSIARVVEAPTSKQTTPGRASRRTQWHRRDFRQPLDARPVECQQHPSHVLSAPVVEPVQRFPCMGIDLECRQAGDVMREA